MKLFKSVLIKPQIILLLALTACGIKEFAGAYNPPDEYLINTNKDLIMVDSNYLPMPIEDNKKNDKYDPEQTKELLFDFQNDCIVLGFVPNATSGKWNGIMNGKKFRNGSWASIECDKPYDNKIEAYCYEGKWYNDESHKEQGYKGSCDL